LSAGTTPNSSALHYHFESGDGLANAIWGPVAGTVGSLAMALQASHSRAEFRGGDRRVLGVADGVSIRTVQGHRDRDHHRGSWSRQGGM
jgi:hypothetical protein